MPHGEEVKRWQDFLAFLHRDRLNFSGLLIEAKERAASHVSVILTAP